MFAERTAFAYPRDGEVIFFSGRQGVSRLADGFLLPNQTALARIKLMENTDIFETAKKELPPIVEKTDKALVDLSNTAIFQRNSGIAATGYRLLTEQGKQPGKLPETIIEGLRQTLTQEVMPTNIFNQKAFAEPLYGDQFTKAYALVNQELAAGSLDTDDPDLKRHIESSWWELNGRLLALNRQGNNDSVLSDLRMASLLKRAFPEREKQINVHDIVNSSGEVIPGQAIIVAERYLQRAIDGRIFDREPKANVRVVHHSPDISKFRPHYQNKQTSETGYHLNSPALAYLTILRFISDFDPDNSNLKKIDNKTINQAETDLSEFAKKNPQVFSDPNMVLLFGEHVTNLMVLKKVSQKEQDKDDFVPYLKTA